MPALLHAMHAAFGYAFAALGALAFGAFVVAVGRAIVQRRRDRRAVRDLLRGRGGRRR